MTGKSNPSKKLRALFLAALMVFSVFAGSMAFAGTAAAATSGNASVSPATAGNTATLTAELTLEQSDVDNEGSISSVELGFGSTPADNGFSDQSGDYTVELVRNGQVEATRDSPSLNLGSAQLDFSSINNIQAGDVVRLTAENYQNPSEGSYDGTYQINYGSDGPSTAVTLSVDGADVDLTASAPNLAEIGSTITVTGEVTNNADSEITQEVRYSGTSDGSGSPSASNSPQSVTVAAGATETVEFEVSLPSGAAGDTITHTLDTGSGSNVVDATATTELTDPADTAFITGDLRDQEGNQIANASEIELIVEADTGSGFQEIETSPISVSGTNDEYTAEVPVQGSGTSYRVSIDPAQVEEVTGEQFESFARTAEVAPGSTERFDVRLRRVITPDNIEVIDSSPVAVADGSDEASFTVQVTTDDFAGETGEPLANTEVDLSVEDNTGLDFPDQQSIQTDENGEATFTVTSTEVRDALLTFEATEGDDVTTTATASFIPESGEGVFVGQVKDIDTADELNGATLYAVQEDRFDNNNIDVTNDSANVDNNDEALFRVIDSSTGAVVENDDYDITFEDSSDFVRVDQLNESDRGVGSGFLGTAGTGTADAATAGAFEFVVTPLESGTYTVQQTEVGNTENPAENDFSNVTEVQVSENLTAEAVAERASGTDANPVATTNENGQATLTNLFAGGKAGVDYVVMAERADYTRQYQNVTITSYDTTREYTERTFLLEQRDLVPDTVNITQVGTHPPLSQTGGAPDVAQVEPFEDMSDDTFQNVSRDGSVDVIRVDAAATNFQGNELPAETNVTVELNESFDGQFLNAVLDSNLEADSDLLINNDQENTTITVSTDEDGTAYVLLQTEQNGNDLNAQKIATLESDQTVQDRSNVTFVGTVVYQTTGSLSGIVTNEQNEPIPNSVVYVEEFEDQDGNVFTIEPVEPIEDATEQEVLETEFIINDTARSDTTTVTGAELQSYDFGAFDRVSLRGDVLSVTLLDFPSEEQGQAQYTLPRVPAQDPDGVDYTLVRATQLESGTQGAGDSTPVRPDFTQEANVVIVGAEPEFSEFTLDGLEPTEATVEQGENVTFSATVFNAGNIEDTKDVTAFVGDTELSSEEFTLSAQTGDVVEVTADTSVLEPGTYAHGFETEDDRVEGSLTVEDSSSNGDVTLQDVLNTIDQYENDNAELQDVLNIIDQYEAAQGAN
jgi:surface glycoprotein (TIGR04207 family)